MPQGATMQIPESEIIVTKDGAELLRKTVRPGDYVIGREPECEVHVEAEGVSGRHAQLTVNFDHALIEDLGSESGTLVNGNAVKEPTRLWPNQKIQVGATTVEVHRIKTVPLPDVSLAPSTATVKRLLPEEFLREKKYDIGGVVAQGGMGAILNAKEASIERVVAMKVMLDGSNPDDLARFVAEAKVTGQLEHPNIVPVHELGVDENDQAYYTMKFVRGITLRKVLDLMAGGDEATIRQYPLGTLLTVFQKVCDAIAFAHSKGVIHRDLKPENIMLGDFGEVLVMDWGLAKVLSHADNPQSSAGSIRTLMRARSVATATMTGSIMGTPQYMAPEQARGEVETLDARADIYALGAILYHILALRPSITGDDAYAIVAKVARGEIEPLTNRQSVIGNRKSEVSDSLAAVVRKAMSLQPSARYQSVADLQGDIAAFQNGFATGAEKAGLGKQLLLALRRHKAVATSIAAALVVLVAVVAGFTVKVIGERNRAERALADLQRTAPTLVAEGRKLIDIQQFDDALAKISFAVTIEPRNAEYRLLRAQLLQAMVRLEEAAAEFHRVLALGPNASAQANLALCDRLHQEYPNVEAFDRAAWQQLYTQMSDEGRAMQMMPIATKLGRAKDAAEAVLKARLVEWRKLPGWEKKPESERLQWIKDGTLVLRFGNTLIEDLSTVRGLPLSDLQLDYTRVTDLSPVQGMRLRAINLVHLRRLTDLSPLKGMPLENINSDGSSALSDFSPLAGMKLKRFSAGSTQLRDLSVLSDMPLEWVSVAGAAITDLNAITGKSLVYFNGNSCPRLADISAVRTMRLKTAHFCNCPDLHDFTPLLQCAELEKLTLPRNDKAIEVLRKHSRLKLIGYDVDQEKRAAEFWAEFDSLWKIKADDTAVMSALRKACVDVGLPTEVEKYARRLEDGTYVLDFTHLKDVLRIIPNLHDLPVSEISMWDCRMVTDLAPLAGLPLRKLVLRAVPAKSYDALKECPLLGELDISGSRNLKSVVLLAGLKLNKLNAGASSLDDLSPLAGMPLRELIVDRSQVSDLSPLASLPLVKLRCEATRVTDLRPLLSCPTLEMLCIPDKATNIGELHALKKLRRLSFQWEGAWPAQTAAEFWKEYDAQHAGK